MSPSPLPIAMVGLWTLLAILAGITFLVAAADLWTAAAALATLTAVPLLWSLWIVHRSRKAELRITSNHAIFRRGRQETRIPLHAVTRVEEASAPDGTGGLAVHWWDGHQDHRHLVAWRLTPEERAWLKQALTDRIEGGPRDRESEKALDALRQGVEVR